MKKTILFIAYISFSFFLSGQTSNKTDFNFGFEKITNRSQLPDNWLKWGTADYSLKVDYAEKHSGEASMLIQRVSNGTGRSLGCVAYSIPAIYEGHKIELKAYMKLQNVENGQAGLIMRIDGKNNIPLQFDNMLQYNIHGSSDWTLYSVKLRLPKNATMINIGALITGTGKLWMDDFQVLIDGVDINKGIPKLSMEPQAGKNVEVEKGSNNLPESKSPSGTEDMSIIEKVYLHSDRGSYYPGDDIWFKAYLVDASERLLSDHSNNLHVELISPSSEIIDSRIVKVNEGLGNGDFKLPEKIQSGMYRLRAYTNYMRNFGDQIFFNKDITVINSSDAVKEFSDSINYKRDKPEISFFPEGGSLVDHVTSTIAFKAVDDNGSEHDISGEIYSSAGEKVTEFRSIHNGMGSFSLNPIPGLSYFALIKSRNGDLLKYDIPKSFPEGVVLNISKNQSGQLSLIFRTNPETFPLVSAHDLSITVSVRNIPMKTYSFRMKSLNSFFNLPTSDLPDGIIMLTLSGADNIPLYERLAFIENKDDVKVKVETEKTEYRQRDSVSVKISLKTDSTIPQNAFLSLSATDNIFTDNSSRFPSNISSWFLLESDVRGLVEEPSYYFDSSNPNRLKDLDLLLLTQGWRDFTWKYKTMAYPSENGFTISGRVRKKFADVPLKNVSVNISIFKSGKPFINTVQTDSTGRFRLEGVDLTGDAKLIVSSLGEKGRGQSWLFLDSLNYSSANVQENVLQTNLLLNENQPERGDNLLSSNQLFKEHLKTYIQYADIKYAVQKKYKLSDTINPGEVNIVAKRSDAPESAVSRSRRYLMGTPDISVMVTRQYESYSNVLKFIIAKFWYGVKIKNPIFLLNGMPVAGETLEWLPVSWIERVDVSDKMASYAVWGAGTGEVPIDAVISIVTRDGASPISNTPAFHSVNVNISGYNEPRIFYSPKHHTKLESDYKPDLRTTLFWEPNIKVENNKDVLLNYYNADNPSKVKVIVEGMTTGGIPVTGKTEYEVK